MFDFKKSLCFPTYAQIFLVGGAVRDALLGRVVVDRDYVVVGMQPEEMVALGFKPVGKDFPVFLHPVSREEYALARTERKTSLGYRGFQVYAGPEVTLEEDLARRDLTMNAIAQNEYGELIDPFGGVDDIKKNVFRHVNDAFCEDPVRILRLARFGARLPHFTIAPDTLRLMKLMVERGETSALVPERVWQELTKGLLAAKPSRMISILYECGALAVLLPEIACLFEVSSSGADFFEEFSTDADVMLYFLDIFCVGQKRGSIAENFSVLMFFWLIKSSKDDVLLLSQRLRLPSSCRDLAVLVSQEYACVVDMVACTLDASILLAFFNRVDLWRRYDRFNAFLNILKCLTTMKEDSVQFLKKMDVIQSIAVSVKAFTLAEIVKRYVDHPEELKAQISIARLNYISTILSGLRE